MARALTDNAGPTVDWLADHGLGYSDIFFSGDNRVPRGHVVKGGGQGIVDCALSALRAYPRVDFASVSAGQAAHRRRRGQRPGRGGRCAL